MYSTTTILHSHFLTTTPLLQTSPLQLLNPSTKPPRFLSPLCRSSSGGDGEGGNNSGPSPAPETVGIRFRRGSKRRQRKNESLNSDPMAAARAQAQAQAQAPAKKWEEMTLSEKALELYVGEKGALYWLNKFAYASIFIVIGAWILFRFVGPALNLYQLDSPPLPPTAMLKGS